MCVRRESERRRMSTSASPTPRPSATSARWLYSPRGGARPRPAGLDRQVGQRPRSIALRRPAARSPCQRSRVARRPGRTPSDIISQLSPARRAGMRSDATWIRATAVAWIPAARRSKRAKRRRLVASERSRRQQDQSRGLEIKPVPCPLRRVGHRSRDAWSQPTGRLQVRAARLSRLRLRRTAEFAGV